MTEINISADLETVTMQLRKGIEELQELDGKRQQLTQQIQNLNGVAMYLRGKEPTQESEDTEVLEDTNKES